MTVRISRIIHRLIILAVCVISSIEAAAVLKSEDLIQTNVVERDTHLGPEDFLESRRLLEVDLNNKVPGGVDPLLKGRKFEGDIAGLNKSTIHQFIENSNNNFARAAIRDSWRRWPDGQIPYVISSRYGTYSKRIVAKAMDEYHTKTCIRFVPRDENKHRDYIYIFPDDGCYSLVGRTGGRQPVSLDSGCMQTGTVQHELMHAVGFFHEQSRSDRDDNIEIVTKNVIPDALDQFEKYSLKTITQLDLPYDYASIMHYGPLAFSKNGQRTIVAKKAGAERMGQREGFSQLDLKKINQLYQCSSSTSQHESSSSSNSPAAALITTTTTDRPFLLTEPPKCENKKWQCYLWSKLGYCRYYPDYMRERCPKSCDMCGGGGKEARDQRRERDQVIPGERTTTSSPITNIGGNRCVDNDSHCEAWQRRNYCATDSGFTAFMRRTCPLSCGVCQRDTSMDDDDN